MKKGLLTISLLLLTLGCLLYGQRDGEIVNPGAPPPSKRFSDMLWYGGGFNLGFSGSGNVTTFQFGLSPMAGYKVFEPFSIGPRVAVQYNYYSARVGNGSTDSASPISWAVGAFARFKILPMIFAHVEMELENQPIVSVDFNELTVSRRQNDNLYLGGGYTSGQGLGSFGYEISILFNINQPDDVVNPPYVFRLGLTYNF